MDDKNIENQPIVSDFQKPQETKNRIIKPLSYFLGAVLLLAVLVFYFYYQIFIPISWDVKENNFTVKRGEGLNLIAKNLEKGGLVRNDFYFIFYVFWKGNSGNLQAGDYMLSASMNIPQIAKKIMNGEAVPKEISVTFPEGLRIAKIDEKLKEAGFRFSISDFRAKDFKEKYDFLKDVPDDANLEGFLFPDTYRLYPEATAKDLVEKMLDNFKKKFTNDLKQEVLNKGKGLYEIMTMASLIEKEVRTFDDRQIVSGIFWERMRRGIPLESCATVAYALNVDKWRYSIQDTKIVSPYNTYLNQGLPPGPICNPGIESIKAAIFPKESPYIFFLTDPETGNTIFSKTFWEHSAKKGIYFK